MKFTGNNILLKVLGLLLLIEALLKGWQLYLKVGFNDV